MAACKGGQSEIVLLLLVNGADPAQKNPQSGDIRHRVLCFISGWRGGRATEAELVWPWLPGRTALHFSCQRGDEVATSILLEHDLKLATMKVRPPSN